MNSLVLLTTLVACAMAKPLLNPYYANGYYGQPYYGYPYAAPYYAPAAVPADAEPVEVKTVEVPVAQYPYAHAPVAPYAPTFASQYHSQDELGQASYGYVHPGQAHSAVRDYTGAVRGRYSYINADGKEIFVDYIADQGGFRVLSNSLPVGPENNLQAPVFEGKAPVFDLEGPAPIEDTAEVKAARKEHLAAHAAALEAAEANPDDAEEAPEKEEAAERR